MALAFRRVTCAPLREFEAAAPDGVVVGIIGENGSGKTRLLRLAARLDRPESGVVEAGGPARLLGPDDPLNLARPPPLLGHDHAGGIARRGPAPPPGG
jgi:ABC-type transport system involved in cytochrome c biogenesis ATPase subunit